MKSQLEIEEAMTEWEISKLLKDIEKINKVIGEEGYKVELEGNTIKLLKGGEC